MSSIYAIGDVQGCYQPLRELVDALPIDRTNDRLWFVGDLVNRGPQNLETLEFVRDLGEQAVVVLGNHDLHLLAIVFGGKSPTRSDTFQDVLDSPKCEELCHWLRKQPLVYRENNWFMVHAGIPHIWGVKETVTYAQEVERTLSGSSYATFFENMYGKYPDQWDPKLTGMDRLRIITNYLTRMRFISETGQLEFAHKTTLDTAPKGFKGWFEYARVRKHNIVFGHWAALEGVVANENCVATDTGCVWGRSLTAVRLKDRARFEWRDGRVSCLP